MTASRCLSFSFLKNYGDYSKVYVKINKSKKKT